LEELLRLGFEGSIVAPAGLMGGDLLKTVGYSRSEIVELRKPFIGGISTREHTVEFVMGARRYGCDLIVFVGGDGTARDIYLSVDSSYDIPVLGIPAGVKVYSGVFALGAEGGAHLVILYRDGYARVEMRPIIDANEEDLRRGVLNIKKYGELPTIVAKNLIQGSKEPGYEYDVEGIARYISEMMKRDRLYIFRAWNNYI